MTNWERAELAINGERIAVHEVSFDEVRRTRTVHAHSLERALPTTFEFTTTFHSPGLMYLLEALNRRCEEMQHEGLRRHIRRCWRGKAKRRAMALLGGNQ